MNLNDLNTPFERHKIIHFAKDGNTVVHRSYEMQPIEGTLYKSRVEKDKWGELYHLFVVFPGIEQGLPLPPPVDLNLFRAGPEELARLEKLPASLGEALSLASESSFVRGIVPEATLEAFMQNKSGVHDPAFGEI